MRDFRVEVLPPGAWQKEMAALGDGLARAVTQGLREESAVTKAQWRAAMEGAGLGKLSKAPKFDVFPSRGASMEAALHISVPGGPRTRGAFESASEGATIKSKRSRSVAIPAPWLPKQGDGRRRMSPRTFPERFGELSFVPGKGDTAFLVVQRRRQPRGAGPWVLGTQGRGASRRVTVIAFILKRRVTQEARFNPQRLANQTALRIPPRIERAINRLGLEGAGVTARLS